MNLQKLMQGTARIDLELSAQQIDRFEIYISELQRWNKTYSLTTIIDPVAIIHKHFLDSLNYYPFLPSAGEILDLGTGPGFPGLPLAIVRPQQKFTLVDGRRKKTLFLELLLQKLELKNVEVIHLHLSSGNAREVFNRCFSAIVTRAVAVMREVVPVADCLLGNRGVLVFSDAHPDQFTIESELEKWPELNLEKLEKSCLPGRASEISIGTIRKIEN